MDVLYITDGSATFVYGGKIVGAKNTRPGQWLGTDITGGTTQKLVKGDVVVVPAGMPHWFKEVPASSQLLRAMTCDQALAYGLGCTRDTRQSQG